MPPRLLHFFTASLLSFQLSGCPSASERASATEGATHAEGATETSQEEGPALLHIPVGELLVGSLPGEPGRKPDREPLPEEVKMGPYRIDALPYPGDPKLPPRLGVSRTEAEALCAARQGRLCTELEWERACKGPTNTLYPSGSTPCAEEGSCKSGFEVESLTRYPEWTASRFGAGGPEAERTVLRGAPSSVPAEERRCARRASEGEIKADELAFRCCYGAPHAQTITEPTDGPAYREVEISKEELTQLLESDPQTAPWAQDLSFFQHPEAARTVLARGPGELRGFTLTTQALEWRPARGIQLLLVTARTGKNTSFVVLYHIAPTQKILAGSFLMKSEPGPVALAYAESIRPRVHFSTCWGCPGETGKALFRAPEEIVLLQP